MSLSLRPSIQMDLQIALLVMHFTVCSIVGYCVRMDAICGCWAQTSPPIAVALIPQHAEFTSTITLEISPKNETSRRSQVNGADNKRITCINFGTLYPGCFVFYVVAFISLDLHSSTRKESTSAQHSARPPQNTYVITYIHTDHGMGKCDGISDFHVPSSLPHLVHHRVRVLLQCYRQLVVVVVVSAAACAVAADGSSCRGLIVSQSGEVSEALL